jgi:NADH-quinone oxidoreductase subunit H
MAKQILTFEEFIKRILKLIFWILLLTPLIIIPVYYAIAASLGLRIDLFALTANPDQLIAFISQMLANEPFRSIFAWTVFPGFTWVALYSTILMGWVERKLTAKIQLRTGPMYAGRLEGILQNVADFFKLLFKEIVIPERADKVTFVAVPFALMAVVGALVALIPLSPTTYIANPSVGAVLVFAILGFTPMVVLLAGWASNSKYPFLGGLRALHQMVSYEIPLVLSLVGVVLITGSLSLMDVVSAQTKLWFIALQPIGALVFYIGALAELERIPFDLPEADTELVSGWQTEYTGMLFGTFQLANFSRMYVLAGLFTVFFLGGWLGPPFLPPEFWFILKTTIVMIAMMLPRSIAPRIRIDLLLRAGWVKLLILAFINLFIALLIVAGGLV